MIHIYVHGNKLCILLGHFHSLQQFYIQLPPEFYLLHKTKKTGDVPEVGPQPAVSVVSNVQLQEIKPVVFK